MSISKIGHGFELGIMQLVSNFSIKTITSEIDREEFPILFLPENPADCLNTLTLFDQTFNFLDE